MTRYFTLILLCFSATAVAVDEAGYGVISDDNFHVKHVSTGTAYREVIGRLGKPLREERIGSQPETDAGETIKLYYAGLYISLFEGEVGEIVVRTTDLAIKGVRVGSTPSNAIVKIGKAKPVTINGRTSLRYRCVTKNGAITDAELRLFLEEDRITEISLWFPTT